MEVKCFKLGAFLNSTAEVFHIARTTIQSQNDLQLHKHGFAEVFWIKEGNGIHLINGQEIPLSKGMLCMIRPNDEHTFKLGKNREGLVVTNIAFFEESLSYFKNRYFSYSDTYFWTENQFPYTVQLDTDQLSELSSLADRLLSQPRDLLHLDFMMIHIFRLVCSIQSNQTHIPHWLALALDKYNTPENFRKGTEGFISLSGRTVDHVNRVIQKHLKQTLTETISKARLQYASRQLIMTNASIKSICFDCGIESVSYFHRLFKNHFGITPNAYRKKNHKVF